MKESILKYLNSNRLELYMEDGNLKDLENCIVAVDSSQWLHRGARICARELALNLPTNRYIDYFFKRVEELLSFGIIPIFVFDGASLPAKREQNQKREMDRETHLQMALKWESLGNAQKAREEFASAVRVTPDMVHMTVLELKRRGLDFIISPYEADAQIAFLFKKKKVVAVISDDSDMLPYGCKRVFRDIPHIGFKEFHFERLVLFSQLQAKKKKKDRTLDLSKFTLDKIVTMCVLAGCDYLEAVKKIKLGKAYDTARKYPDFHTAYVGLKAEGIIFPDNYPQKFQLAVMTYRHQTVFDPDKKITVHMSECTNDIEDLSFLGEILPEPLAIGIACGDINPHTRSSYSEPGNSIHHNISFYNTPSPIAAQVSGVAPRRKVFDKGKLRKEPETEICASMLDAISECIQICGPRLDATQLRSIVEELKQVLIASSTRRNERAERVKAEDFDAEEGEMLKDENEAEEDLFDQVDDCLGTLLKTYKASFLPLFDELLPYLMPMWGKDRTSEEKRTAICIFDDVAEHCGDAAFKYYETFLPAVLEACNDTSTDVRQAAVYGVGVCAEFGGGAFRPFVGEALARLDGVIRHPDALHPDNVMAYDNAVSALGRICQFHRDSINAAQIVPEWLNCLPLKGDLIEAKVVHDQLCSMVERSDGELLGLNHQYLPKIVSVFADVLCAGKDLASEQTVSRMINLLRQLQQTLPPAALASMFSSLQPQQQLALQSIISS